MSLRRTERVRLLTQDIYLACYVDRSGVRESWEVIGGLDAAKSELVSPYGQAFVRHRAQGPV